jgi:hypothetical protein
VSEEFKDRKPVRLVTMAQEYNEYLAAKVLNEQQYVRGSNLY